MRRILVDIMDGRGWDYEPFDIIECKYVPFKTYEVIIYGDCTTEFTNAKEAYEFYVAIKVPKVLYGIMQSGSSELLEHHQYE